MPRRDSEPRSQADSKPDPRGTVQIQVNGEPRGVPAACTVGELLESLGMAGRTRVAVAVNRDVVARSDRAHRRLAAGDRVEILEAVGGG